MKSNKDDISLYSNSNDSLLVADNSTIVSDNNQENFVSEFPENSSEGNKFTIIEQNFNYLKTELSKNTRDIEALDLYKIEGTFSNNIDGAIAFNELLKNNSVIADNVAEINGETYVPGDLLYKTANGQPQKIELGFTGYYKPIVNENGEFVGWEWRSGIPTEEDFVIDLKLSELKQGYGISQQIGTDRSVAFEKINTLEPIIRFYNENGEEVFWDYSLTSEKNIKDNETTTRYVITGIPSYIKHVEVK